MQLKPCVQCRRHVARESTRCPFCDAQQQATGLPGRIVAHAGRVSRAAIFAGATACSATTPTPNGPPPPPPLDPVVTQQFATAPPPAAGKASVRGFITVDGHPLNGVVVIATGEDKSKLQTTTGVHGEYSFIDLEPGHWILVVDYQLQSHRPQDHAPVPEQQLQLTPDANARHDIRLSTPPLPERDRGPCCKPYGAPPARRRVV